VNLGQNVPLFVTANAAHNHSQLKIINGRSNPHQDKGRPNDQPHPTPPTHQSNPVHPQNHWDDHPDPDQEQNCHQSKGLIMWTLVQQVN
jgi:hypothetical protein